MEFTESELLLIRAAIDEFRTTIPDHIRGDEARIERWREYRELYDREQFSIREKVTDKIVEIVDAELEKRKLFAGIHESDQFTIEQAYKDFAHLPIK